MYVQLLLESPVVLIPNSTHNTRQHTHSAGLSLIRHGQVKSNLLQILQTKQERMDITTHSDTHPSQVDKICGLLQSGFTSLICKVIVSVVAITGVS